MKGHIETRGKGRHRIIIELGTGPSGERLRDRYTFHGTKREADAELVKRLHQLETGTYVEENKLTVAVYLERWLTDYAEPATARRTYLRYREICELHLMPALGTLLLKNLRPMHIQSYYTEALKSGRRVRRGSVKEEGKSQVDAASEASAPVAGGNDADEAKPVDPGLSAQTVLHHHRVLRTALHQAVKWQVLTVNPADAVSPPRPERKEVVALSQEETVALLAALEGTRLYAPAVIAVTTGMREGEVLGLRWRDVDLENARLQVRQTLQIAKGELFFKSPKTGSGERSIALMPLTVEVLRKHRAEQNELRLRLGSGYMDQDLVLARDDGQPWHPGSFSAEWRKTTRDLGTPVKFHNLRHTHATLLLANGEHPKVVQERLGHSSIGITMDTYSHVMPSMQEAAADRLEGSLGLAVTARRGSDAER
jgi:integrase